MAWSITASVAGGCGRITLWLRTPDGMQDAYMRAEP